MSSVSNGLYFLTLPLVSAMRVIYRKIRRARYLYIKRNVEKVWGARYKLGARYLSKNTVYYFILLKYLLNNFLFYNPYTWTSVNITYIAIKWGLAVAQLIEALRYKLECRRFDSQ